MCGRFYMASDEVTELLLAVMPDARIRGDKGDTVKTGDVFPSDTAAVIANSRALTPAAFAMKWGFPHETRKLTVINARSETAADKPVFAESAQKRRCLIPLTAYYEWEKRGGQKIKYSIAPEDQLTFLGGLYRLDMRGGASFVILTRPAADDIRYIHGRMPVLIGAENAQEWLSQERSLSDVIGLSSERVEYRTV